MTDTDAFELGRNIATTPGKVVYQNELMQLLQYEPTTEQVYKRPLMIVPPWINKFYILDLQPKNSFIKFCTDQGFTTFVLSWVNPDKQLAHKSFEDYMLEGPLAALDAIEEATGEKEITGIGYCLGGTLMASTLAYMATKRDNRIKACTFFTTLVDFSDPGELGIFMDEEQLRSLEEQMTKRGYLEGAEMASTFNLLRANDLIWSFVINNYLLGQGAVPVRSALLELRQHAHAGHHAQLLPAQVLPREQADRAECGNTSPACRSTCAGSRCRSTGSSTREDHIAPWTSTYAATQIYQGAEAVRARGLGSHRGRGQPAGRQQVRLLDQRRAAGHARRLPRGCHPAPRLVVARLVGLERPLQRPQGSGPQARRRQAAGDRGCSGLVREDQGPLSCR